MDMLLLGVLIGAVLGVLGSWAFSGWCGRRIDAVAGEYGGRPMR